MSVLRSSGLLAILLASLSTPSLAAPVDDETVARLAVDLQGHRLERALALVAPKVEIGPLWFVDPACAKQFAKPQVVTGTARAALIACLDKLAASGTSSHHVAGSGVILFHDGLALAITASERQVVRIGFVDPDKTDATTPTVFRLAGAIASRLAPPRELVETINARPDHRAVVTYKTCLDAKGKVTRTRLVAASGIADFDKLGAATIAGYAFAPVQIGGKPTAVCEVIRFAHDTNPTAAPPAATRPQNVAPATLEASRTAGERWISPDAAIKKQILAAKKTKVIGAWKLCIDDTGAFSSTTALKSTGFPTYDALIERELKKWAFKPFVVGDVSIPVCTAVTIIYSP